MLAVSPGPPAVEDMLSVCLTQCIFNELRLSSVFHSMGLNDAIKKTYRLHIVLDLGSINNNVEGRKSWKRAKDSELGS